MDQHLIEQAQADICKQYGQQFLACSIDSILGIAVHTLGHQTLHGLRHKPEGNTNGWYIWGGEYSSAFDFFSPQHTAHLLEKAPELMNYLGLPPGCRFLLAKDSRTFGLIQVSWGPRVFRDSFSIRLTDKS